MFNGLIAISALAAALSSAVHPVDHTGMNHATMDGQMSMTAPATAVADAKEPGQSAYAAIGEVVEILRADPSTDWSKVDVDALRAHLVDMDNVTLRSKVEKTSLPNGARFLVTGEGDVVGSIQRMTKSHFAQPDVGTGWKMIAQPVANGAIVTATSPNSAEADKIVALGFYGILTMGMHHQPHHLMIARGAMSH